MCHMPDIQGLEHLVGLACAVGRDLPTGNEALTRVLQEASRTRLAQD
jgi:hypothetical protein